jgi:hypothetical protein
LISALALAEASGRRFTMLWTRCAHCNAAFGDLFEPWPNLVAESPFYGYLFGIAHRPFDPYDPAFYRWQANQDKGETARALALNNLLAEEAPHITLSNVTWLFISPSHLALVKRSLEFFHHLQPIAAIQARIDAFVAKRFRPQMIGVHLRRGDLTATFPEFARNTQTALAAVDNYLARYPEAGIFLSTDDGAAIPDAGLAPQEGIKTLFRRRYGERVVCSEPRSLDRAECAAIQDAVMDLWLLRRTTAFVGTRSSSFSILAALGRTIPVTMAGFRDKKDQ